MQWPKKLEKKKKKATGARKKGKQAGKVEVGVRIFTMYLLYCLIFKPSECYLLKTVKAIRRKREVFQLPQPCAQAALGKQKN